MYTAILSVGKNSLFSDAARGSTASSTRMTFDIDKNWKVAVVI